MSSASRRLAETDRRIRAAMLRIDVFRTRIARRARNPALAEQAERLLPLMEAYVEKLISFRRSLSVAAKHKNHSLLRADVETPRTAPTARLPRPPRGLF